MKHLAALILAVALVLGAMAARRAIDDSRSVTVSDSESEPTSLICATELAVVCTSLERDGVRSTVEDPGMTATRLARSSGIDQTAWLTTAPWRDLVALERDRAGLTRSGLSSTVLARSPLVVMAQSERAPVLTARCGRPLSWDCVGGITAASWSDIGGEAGWGRVKIGIPDARRTTAGLLAIAGATTGRLGRSDIATNDIADDDGFGLFFEQLATSSPLRSGLVTRFLVAPATFGAVVDLEATARQALDNAADSGSFSLLDVTPEVTADVVVLGTAPVSRPVLTRALRRAGWRAPSDSSLPAKNPLPWTGVLEYLLDRYGNVTR